jgi:hypothetical protein
MKSSIPRTEWAAWLQAFSDRNASRRTVMEVDDPDLGAQPEETEYPLRGVSYDRRDDRIEIMLGELECTDRHLTHSITAPDAVDVLAGRDGRDAALRVRSGYTQTLLRFES